MGLPQDVIGWIERVHGRRAAATLEKLDALRDAQGNPFGDRVVRCIVYAAWLFPRRSFEGWMREAQVDYRDVIMAAEYDDCGNRVRDFANPFRPEDFPDTQ